MCWQDKASDKFSQLQQLETNLSANQLVVYASYDAGIPVITILGVFCFSVLADGSRRSGMYSSAEVIAEHMLCNAIVHAGRQPLTRSFHLVMVWITSTSKANQLL